MFLLLFQKGFYPSSFREAWDLKFNLSNDSRLVFQAPACQCKYRYSVGFCKKKTNLHLQSNGTHFCNSCLWHHGFLNSCLLTYVVGMIMASAGELVFLQQPLGHSGSERGWGNSQEAVRRVPGMKAIQLYQVGSLGPTGVIDVKCPNSIRNFSLANIP